MRWWQKLLIDANVLERALGRLDQELSRRVGSLARLAVSRLHAAKLIDRLGYADRVYEAEIVLIGFLGHTLDLGDVETVLLDRGHFGDLHVVVGC